MNVGAIVEIPMLSIRVASPAVSASAARSTARRAQDRRDGGGLPRAAFAPGDTFLFGGQVWRFETIVGMDCLVTPAPGAEAQNPSWGGSKFALSTYLAARVRRMIADQRRAGRACRTTCRSGCRSRTCARKSPPRTRCWWRPSSAASATSWWPIPSTAASATAPSATSSPAGWSGPDASRLGFVANDYALAVWSLKPMGDLDMGDVVPGGHAGRRSRRLARRKLHDEAHLPSMRHHRRAHSTEISRDRKSPAARSPSPPT